MLGRMNVVQISNASSRWSGTTDARVIKKILLEIIKTVPKPKIFRKRLFLHCLLTGLGILVPSLHLSFSGLSDVGRNPSCSYSSLLLFLSAAADCRTCTRLEAETLLGHRLITKILFCIFLRYREFVPCFKTNKHTKNHTMRSIPKPIFSPGWILF